MSVEINREITASMECDCCGRQTEEKFWSKYSDEEVIDLLKEKGWIIRDSEDVCPECVEAREPIAIEDRMKKIGFKKLFGEWVTECMDDGFYLRIRSFSVLHDRLDQVIQMSNGTRRFSHQATLEEVIELFEESASFSEWHKKFDANIILLCPNDKLPTCLDQLNKRVEWIESLFLNK